MKTQHRLYLYLSGVSLKDRNVNSFVIIDDVQVLECVKDESSVAAAKAIELDTYLGCSPVNYREVQGCESSVFLNYFRKLGGVR